jgi:excisionase family DNA binding protein
MTENGEKKIAMGFDDAAETVGLSPTYLRNAAEDPDKDRRLTTVRVGRRRLIRASDLQDWFERVAHSETV